MLHMCALVLPPWQVLVALLGITTPNVNLLYHPINWTTKVVALLVSILCLLAGWVTADETGLRGPSRASLRVVVPVVGLVLLVLFADAYFSRHAFAPLWWHEQLFYAIVPGLEEELFYRGILLGLLGRVFPHTIPLPGTRTSWGGLVGVLLFALGHGIRFWSVSLLGNGWQTLTHAWWWQSLLHFPFPDAAYYGLMGLLFLWVRERTGSVWAAVASHCLVNTALTIGHAIS
ncbi:CPBP family intramembrane glutamic endopeptidase [Hymenobacter sp. BRD67]|uniref:CPBP family intramembrane glutamic endopeptidase n=1 Tax=Hymenobacter sp. BRD67 TaxID=2675877 RepID=UPI001566E7B4|nr:CPBP family intramembrane glutamic endopeptidase [Hymenobacter sp. BRD67]QKG54471.1 CPBP family intramembrane metalloprotease [Hymenobacter sp. BRD67]